MEIITVRNRKEINIKLFNELVDLSYSLFAKYKHDTNLDNHFNTRVDVTNLYNSSTGYDELSIWQQYDWGDKERFRRDWLEMMEKPNFVLFLIVRKSDDKLIGYAAGHEIFTAKEFRHEINLKKRAGSNVIDYFFSIPERTFLFSEIGVREDSRGHGVGKILISLRFAFAIQIPNIKRIIFFTHPKAETPRGFYQSIGFRQEDLNIPGREKELQFFVYRVLEPKTKIG